MLDHGINFNFFRERAEQIQLKDMISLALHKDRQQGETESLHYKKSEKHNSKKCVLITTCLELGCMVNCILICLVGWFITQLNLCLFLFLCHTHIGVKYTGCSLFYEPTLFDRGVEVIRENKHKDSCSVQIVLSFIYVRLEKR